MIDVQVYRDEGPVTGGRGTPLLVDNFNMKKSASYTTYYYPTKETSGAPMVRPLQLGEQDISFPVYTFFRLMGGGEQVKNLRMNFSITPPKPPDPEDPNIVQMSDKMQLFYKLTNVYAEPAAAYDGSMILLSMDNGLQQVQFYPFLSPVGPHQATTRQTAYTLTTPMFTNYFVTQVRVPKGCLVGNSAEFTLQCTVDEYEV